MASTGFRFGLTILFLSLLVVATAGDYTYSSNPDCNKPDYGYGPKPKPKPDIVKPDSGYGPTPDTVKPDYEGGSKPKPDTVRPNYQSGPKVGNDKPAYGYGSKPQTPVPIGIEGLVLCKYGSNYVPVEGAITRVTCSSVDQNGYETTPFSCLIGATDAKGYFYAVLPPFGVDNNIKTTECKAYLQSSPLKNCNVPTDVNKGISGAILSSYRMLKDNNVKLYSVGPFFYTSEPTSTPSGY